MRRHILSSIRAQIRDLIGVSRGKILNAVAQIKLSGPLRSELALAQSDRPESALTDEQSKMTQPGFVPHLSYPRNAGW
jgi:hypothetical protein